MGGNKTLSKLYFRLIQNDKLPSEFYEKVFDYIKNNKRFVQYILSEDEKNMFANSPFSQSIQHILREKILILTKSQFMMRTYNILNQIYPLSLDDLEVLCSENFNTYKSFFVFGCPRSTDIDIVCIVENHTNGVPFPLFTKEVKRLHSELQELGYDISRGIDLSLVVYDDFEKKFIAHSKGGPETQNILLMTYKYHMQKYSLPNLTFVTMELFDKLRGIAKYILDNLEDIVVDYQEVRYERQENYTKGIDDMIRFSVSMISNFKNASELNCDVTKSLTMKFIQLILLEVNEYEYSKLELAKKIDKIILNSEQHALWFLFRGKYGEFSQSFFQTLLDKYAYYVDKYFNSIHMIRKIVNQDDLTENSTSLPNDLYEEFLFSPLCATDKFKELWQHYYPSYDIRVNDHFITPSDKPEHCEHLRRFDDNIIWVDQRTPEWLELLTYYTCGKNSKNIPNTLDGTFNLIRGSIGEILVTKFLDLELLGLNDFQKVNIGLLVKTKQKGANGIAPDLLLVKDDEIIPVEIKCLKNRRKNSDYYREMHIAKLQCERVKEILGECVKRRLIILSWFDDGFVMDNFIEYMK